MKGSFSQEGHEGGQGKVWTGLSLRLAEDDARGSKLGMSTIFSKIIAGKIPARTAYEDDQCLAFHDIQPKAPVHVLIIPKKEIERITASTEQDQPLLGHLLFVAQKIAEEQGLKESGFRLVINNGPDAGESVAHLHVHLLGGRALAWPPG